MPKLQCLKIGASGSMLMAAMTLESDIPARCWLAPRIATARYKPGATFLPVWPTCHDGGHQPESHAAREAAVIPPSIAANCCNSVKASGPPSPRPPDTMMRASSRRASPVTSDLRSTIRVGAFVGTLTEATATVATDKDADAGASNARARNQTTAGVRFNWIV